MPTQECAEPGCQEPGAFTTRTRPAWCLPHITAVLDRGGLEPLEPFVSPAAWRLTQCLACGCQAHYRFEYVLDKVATGEPVCRACYWRTWAQGLAVRAEQDASEELQGPTQAQEHGFEHLEALPGPAGSISLHRVRCRTCQRIQVSRLHDLSWGCNCQSNARRAAQTTRVQTGPSRDLLKDSGLDVLHWWDHAANSEHDPSAFDTVTVRARRQSWWRCPECAHGFQRSVADMLSLPGSACPRCAAAEGAERMAQWEAIKDVPVAAIAALAQAWADAADPHEVSVGDWGLRRFRCPAGHLPRVNPRRYLEAGCPSCRGEATRQATRAQADPSRPRLNPEIAAQWHPTLNGGLDLLTISPASQRQVWWLEPSCGHQWQDSPAGRERGSRRRCPQCGTRLDSLAYHFPVLASQWSPDNPVTAWHVRPSSSTPFVPHWVCSEDPTHQWQSSLSSRSSGAGCPQCREHGKSSVELQHFAVAREMFASAVSGAQVRSETFVRRPFWWIDVLATTASGVQVAIEYDGAYWHAEKGEVDADKTADLLGAGYRVARLRERPLPPLPIADKHYLEVAVHSAAPDPARAIGLVAQWVRDSA